MSVNDINNNDTREFDTIVLVDNANNLVSYFVLFSGLDNSETSALDPVDPLKPASNAYINDITGNFDTTSSDNVDVALIIKKYH